MQNFSILHNYYTSKTYEYQPEYLDDNTIENNPEKNSCTLKNLN